MADYPADWPREAVALHEQMTLLKALLSKDNGIQLCHLMAYGEEYDYELHVWSDQLITRPNYRGPVSFTPWRNYRPNRFAAGTALQAVLVIVQAAYARVFPNPPRIWATNADAEIKQALTTVYRDTHAHRIWPRIQELREDIDREAVSELLVSADVELKQLLHVPPVVPVLPAVALPALPDDQVRTITGVVVLKCDLTEESRTSGEWADICDWDGGRKTFGDKTKSGDIRAVRDPNSKEGSPKYQLHRDDIVAFDEKAIPLLRSSKPARDEKLKSVKKPGRGGSRKNKA